MRYRKLHPVTADMRREISVAVLARAGAFKGRGLQFPFQHLESAPDHIKVFRVGDKSRQSPQIVAVTWRPMTFGMKPFFVCPRCSARRVYLYFDTIAAYCRCCGDLRSLSQRKRARTRLLIRSHRLRTSLGDETGKPGDKFPPRPFNRKQRGYRKDIATLRTIESKYLNATAIAHRHLWRERDELGRFIADEVDTQTISDQGER
jgi:hypothetical protein